VLSDSGGIQEEAPSFRVPVLVLRKVTERPEGLAPDGNVLVGTSGPAIRAAFRRLLAKKRPNRALSSPQPSAFGDGRAAARITRILSAALCGTRVVSSRLQFRYRR
jgi:UDP-N-acetylglucosamine 2-epimerase (non-hydrolysing)